MKIQKYMQNDNKQIYNYTVILEREQDGGYHAFCPILKGCHSQGDTFEETIENITEAIELYLESLMADDRPIPKEDLIFKPLNILVGWVEAKKPNSSNLYVLLDFIFAQLNPKTNHYKSIVSLI